MEGLSNDVLMSIFERISVYAWKSEQYNGWIERANRETILKLRLVHSGWKQAMDKCTPFWSRYFGPYERTPESVHNNCYKCRNPDKCRYIRLHFTNTKRGHMTQKKTITEAKKTRKRKVQRKIDSLTRKKAKIKDEIKELENEMDTL